MCSLGGIGALAEQLQTLPPSSYSTSAGSFLDDLCDAFSDDDVPGVGSKVQPPYIHLPSCGLRMKFDIKGPEEAPKLLYIPGPTDDLRKTLSMLHCDAFAKKFRTLTCDLRNQGETTPFSVDKFVPLETYVEDLMALVDEAFAPTAVFHVVGWSFGAALALLLARLHPGRVQSVAVLAGGYWKPSQEPEGTSKHADEELFGKDWQWVKTLSSYSTMDTEERCKQMLLHSDARRSDNAFRETMVPSFEWLLDNFVRSENTTVMNSPRSCKDLGAGVLRLAEALYVQGTDKIEEISTPTIIIHGRHDGMHSVERAVALKQKMKSAMLVILEDEGHVMVTAAVDTALSFMQPQTSVKASLQDSKVLSYDLADQALQEISECFMKESCRSKLIAVFEHAGLTNEEKEAESHQICVRVQRPILDKYGISSPTSVGADQSWFGFAFGWADSPDALDAVEDLMSRRLAALEKNLVVELKKALQKKQSGGSLKARSMLYSQQKTSTKAVVETANTGYPSQPVIPSIDTEDFIRRALQHTSTQQLEKMGLKRVEKSGYTVDFGGGKADAAESDFETQRLWLAQQNSY